MAKRLKVLSETTVIECVPYRCSLAARSCAARHEEAHRTRSILEMRKGLHLRGPDLTGCFNCSVGAKVRAALSRIRDEAAAEAESVTQKRWISPKLPK